MCRGRDVKPLSKAKGMSSTCPDRVPCDECVHLFGVYRSTHRPVHLPAYIRDFPPGRNATVSGARCNPVPNIPWRFSDLSTEFRPRLFSIIGILSPTKKLALRQSVLATFWKYFMVTFQPSFFSLKTS